MDAPAQGHPPLIVCHSGGGGSEIDAGADGNGCRHAIEIVIVVVVVVIASGRWHQLTVAVLQIEVHPYVEPGSAVDGESASHAHRAI